MDRLIRLPLYARITFCLIGIFIFFSILYTTQWMMLPLIFSSLLAIVLYPVVNFFVRRGISKVFSILITLLMIFLVISAFGSLLYSQASNLYELWPTLNKRFTLVLSQLVAFVSDHFHIKSQNINDWISKEKAGLGSYGATMIEQTLLIIRNLVATSVLIAVCVFFILYYHTILIEFIYKLFGKGNINKVSNIVTETKKLIQHYITGLLIEALIVCGLYTAGLLLMGIDFAFLLGFIAAIVNVIPIIGGIIALSLIMIITISTKDSSTYPLLIMALSIFIHVVDNTFIIPKIVASKVNVNALVSLIVLLSVGDMFGIPGMIICIPVTGVLKLIFDQIPTLKPLGHLMGNETA